MRIPVIKNEDDIKSDLKKFWLRVCLILFVLFLASLASSIFYTVHQKRGLSLSYTESNRNQLLIGSYREARTSLTPSLEQGFSLVEYYDARESKELSIGRQKTYFITWKVEQTIPISITSPNHPKLIFYYSPLESIPVILALWGVIFAINIPIFVFLSRKLKQFYQQRFKEKSLIKLGVISRKIAHDIRSPLSSLKIVGGLVDYKKTEHKEVFDLSISRIDSIASDVLKMNAEKIENTQKYHSKNNPEISNKNKDMSVKIGSITSSLCKMKDVEFEKNSQVRTIWNLNQEFQETTVWADKIELERILSNIINNAYEAIVDDPGLISISGSSYFPYLMLEVRDNGQGIPLPLLSKLGNEEISFGKTSGNGLALFAAKQALRSWGGDLELENNFSGGAIARIRLLIKEI